MREGTLRKSPLNVPPWLRDIMAVDMAEFVVGICGGIFNLRHYWGIEYLGLEWGRATNCTFLNDTQFKKESIE